MATEPSGPGAGPDPRRCDNADEYVLDRLDRADTSMSPAELAEEYDCSNIHMRQVMSRLAQDGEVKRVSRGQYVRADDEQDRPEEETADVDLSFPTGSDEGDTQENTESPDDGANATEGEDMPTPEEYQRQHTESSDDAADADEREDTSAHDDEANADVQDDGGSADGEASAPAPVIPMDPTKFGALLAAALVLWLTYRALSGSSSSEEQPEQTDEQAQPNGGGLLGDAPAQA